jgi:hypothetical protein
VTLPEWGVRRLIAKIDTGARTSAIHVEQIRRIGEDRIHFELVRDVNDESRNLPVETSIVRETTVRPSSGHRQPRFVVETEMVLGPVRKRIEVTLVSRRHMLCRMLIGRTALADHFLVDAGGRHLLTARTKKHMKKKESS